jgi:hypothetical protein
MTDEKERDALYRLPHASDLFVPNDPGYNKTQ